MDPEWRFDLRNDCDKKRERTILTIFLCGAEDWRAQDSVTSSCVGQNPNRIISVLIQSV